MVRVRVRPFSHSREVRFWTRPERRVMVRVRVRPFSHSREVRFWTRPERRLVGASNREECWTQ